MVHAPAAVLVRADSSEGLLVLRGLHTEGGEGVLLTLHRQLRGLDHERLHLGPELGVVVCPVGRGGGVLTVVGEEAGGKTGLALLAYLESVSRDVTETPVWPGHCREVKAGLGPGDTLSSPALTHLSLLTQPAGVTGTAGTALRSGKLGLWETGRRPI